MLLARKYYTTAFYALKEIKPYEIMSILLRLLFISTKRNDEFYAKKLDAKIGI